MVANDVERAVLVQHRGSYDNEYLFECARLNVGKFAVVVRVDTDKHDAEEKLNDCAKKAAVGISLGPETRSAGTDSLKIWRVAAKMGLVAICQGSLEEFATSKFEKLVAELHDLNIVVEHLGSPGVSHKSIPVEYKSLLTLAKYSNVYLEVGGLGEMASRPGVLDSGFNMGTVLPYLEMALDAFGANRIMWGSDYPPVSVREGYANALNGILNHSALSIPDIRDHVMHKTAESLFKFDAIAS